MAGRASISAVDRYFAAKAGLSVKHYQAQTSPQKVTAVKRKIDTLISSGKANPEDAKIGTAFAYRLRINLFNSIKKRTEKRSGAALKTNVRANYDNGFLYSLTIATPYYIYPILNNGAEGVGKHKVSLEPRNFMNDGFENGKFQQDLATAVGSIRAALIVSRVDFSLKTGKDE
nr:hypothetical protein [uncultured Flavobacterium sp.]